MHRVDLGFSIFHSTLVVEAMADATDVTVGSSPLATRRRHPEATKPACEMTVESQMIQGAFDKLLKVAATCGPVVERCNVEVDIVNLCAQVPLDSLGPLCVVLNATESVNLPEKPALGTYFFDPSLSYNNSSVYHNYNNDTFICKDEGGNWKVASKLRGGHTYLFSASTGGVKPPVTGWLSASGDECADILVMDQCVWANLCVDYLKAKVDAKEKAQAVPKAADPVAKSTVRKNPKTLAFVAPVIGRAPRARAPPAAPAADETTGWVLTREQPGLAPTPIGAVEPIPAFAKAKAAKGAVEPIPAHTKAKAAKGAVQPIPAFVEAEVEPTSAGDVVELIPTAKARPISARAGSHYSVDEGSEPDETVEAGTSSGINDAPAHQARHDWGSAPRGLDL